MESERGREREKAQAMRVTRSRREAKKGRQKRTAVRSRWK
jgi:hypothetical protein